MYLAGRTRETAYLGPLSVHPDFQSRGIGGALMRDGISLLESRGVEMLFILGHERYYPRFGFRSRVIGVRACEVPLPPGPAVLPEGAEIRPFICGDEIHFRNMWSVAFMEAEGAMDPGPGILPWTSKTKGILSVTLEIRGKVAGHARVDSRQGCEHPILRFLAVDPETARMLLGWIVGQLQWKATVIRLPLPDASGLFPESRFVHERWDAGMALSLSADPAVDAALDRIISGEAPPLAIDFPTMFDF